jgi:hypothetical protein
MVPLYDFPRTGLRCVNHDPVTRCVGPCSFKAPVRPQSEASPSNKSLGGSDDERELGLGQVPKVVHPPAFGWPC